MHGQLVTSSIICCLACGAVRAAICPAGITADSPATQPAPASGDASPHDSGAYPPFSGQWTEEPTWQLGRPSELLEPVLTPAGETIQRVCLVKNRAGVMAIDPSNGKRAWKEPLRLRVQPDLLTQTRDRVLLANRYELVALDPITGARVWSHGDYPEDLDSLYADHESYASSRFHALDRDRLVSFRDDGRAVCLDLEDGSELWSSRLEHLPAGPPVFAHGYLAYPVAERVGMTCCVLDGATSALRHVLAPSAEGAISRILPAGPDRLAVATTYSIDVFDPGTGRRLWKARSRQPIHASALGADRDGLYYWGDGSRLVKADLADGTVLWTSEPIIVNAMESVSLTVRLGQILVMEPQLVLLVDAATGRVILDAPLSADFEVVGVLHTDPYLITLGHAQSPDGRVAVARAWDLRRETTGRAEPDWSIVLGKQELNGYGVGENAVVVQLGTRIQGWAPAGQATREPEGPASP